MQRARTKAESSLPNQKYASRKLVSQVHYTDKVNEILFHEIKLEGNRDYMTFKDFLNALSVYKIDLNNGRSIKKDEYISMGQFMFMQICQQAEMSLHLS